MRILPAKLPGPHVTIGPRKLPTTTAAGAVADPACAMPFEDAVVLGDSAGRKYGVGSDDLAAVLTDCHGWPNTRRALRVAGFVDGRAESVGESRTRVLLAALGLEAPDLQATVSDDKGRLRVDLVFRSRWTIIEFDGRCKYGADGDTVWREERREDRLRRLGYEVVRLTWADLDGPPEAVLAMKPLSPALPASGADSRPLHRAAGRFTGRTGASPAACGA